MNLLIAPINETEHSPGLIQIGPVIFQGPHYCHSKVQDKSGILAIVIPNRYNYQLLNVYATSNLKASANLELAFERTSRPNIAVATHRASDEDMELYTLTADFLWKVFAQTCTGYDTSY
ncbi:MAG: hypothetical protein JSS83_06160 [Cyanobacteria bacterium SZAS LIN-3]|nr:hypothetical protein [Cyanobacteria bacterium SZAS LIN-3]